MSTLLSLGSLIFGFAAWLLPLIYLTTRDKSNCVKGMILSVVSLVFCSIALCMQLFEVRYRVVIEDWSALMDTSSTVASAALILLAVAIILNAIVWFSLFLFFKGEYNKS